MADGKKKRTEGAVYSLHDVINGLVTALKETGYSMDFDNLALKYHIDIGILVRLVSKELPDFLIGTRWLQEGSGYDWLLNSLEELEDGGYVVTFLLEEEI